MSGKGPDQAVRTKLLIVNDGEKFVRLLRDYLDIMLPGLNGLDLLRELRRDSHVPVLMLTALGDAAHELRSPLGRMQVVLGVLEDRVKSEDKPYLRDLQEEVDFMAGLTMEVLTFARAGMCPENVDLVPLNLRPIVERRGRLEAGGSADIQIEIAPDLKVRGERNYLFRAISNLVRNAIRYAGEEGPITTAAHRQADRIVVTVADSGPGVPEEALERIFTPFFRLESARDHKPEGTGLGLAITRSCLEARGGVVTCSNRKPRGLIVTLTLQPA